LKAGVSGSRVGFGSEPTTVTGAGLTTPSDPQPARSAQLAIATGTRRRTGRDFIGPEYHLNHEAQVVRT
jgi:hypothetical protein